MGTRRSVLCARLMLSWSTVNRPLNQSVVIIIISELCSPSVLEVCEGGMQSLLSGWWVVIEANDAAGIREEGNIRSDAAGRDGVMARDS